MKLTILGSGGASPTPRPFCQCEICQKARKLGGKYKRNSCSCFINDIKTVIDCGEDIADSLNLRDIKEVENLFITHWHPDHTFGMRPIMEANVDFVTNTPERVINLYLPEKVYQTLKERFPAIEFYINVQKTAKLHLVEDGDEIKIGDITITVVGYQGKASDTYAYLISEGGKKVLYSPCDTISFDNYRNFQGLDLLINECGLFSNDSGDIKGKKSSEISFSGLMERIREIKPKKTILTHIEEVEMKGRGEEYSQNMKNKYPDVDFDYAYDGMSIEV